jgi:ribosomal protein L37AE/L43A
MALTKIDRIIPFVLKSMTLEAIASQQRPPLSPTCPRCGSNDVQPLQNKSGWGCDGCMSAFKKPIMPR